MGMRITTPSIMAEMLNFMAKSQERPQQEDAPALNHHLLRDPAPSLMASTLDDLVTSGAVTLRLRRAR